MNDAIGLRLALERTEGADEGAGFIGMSGGYLEGEGLGMHELLFACCTGKREVTFVLLHVIVHCVLILFGFLANATDEESIGVLLIYVGHTGLVGGGGFNFL
jgi:hypothetical protein